MSLSDDCQQMYPSSVDTWPRVFYPLMAHRFKAVQTMCVFYYVDIFAHDKVSTWPLAIFSDRPFFSA